MQLKLEWIVRSIKRLIDIGVISKIYLIYKNELYKKKY